MTTTLFLAMMGCSGSGGDESSDAAAEDTAVQDTASTDGATETDDGATTAVGGDTSDPDGDSGVPGDTPDGSGEDCQYPTPDPSDPDVLDVTAYGAVGDGETDDTEAINDAIADAEPGQTVFVPATEDSYLVSTGNRAAVDFTGVAENVTIAGEINEAGSGTNSHIRMDDVTTDNPSGNMWVMGGELNGDKIEGLTIRALRLDGNREENERFRVSGFSMYPSGTGHDITIEDLIVEDSSSRGLGTSGDKVTVRRLTIRNNARHGFNPGGSGRLDPDVHARSLRIVNNGSGNGANGTTMDVTEGNIVVEDVYANGNNQGAKIGQTGGQPDSFVLRRVNLRGARGNGGWRDTAEDGALAGSTITFDRVQVIEPNGHGFELSNAGRYEITTILVDGAGQGNDHNVEIEDSATVDADTIISRNAENGYGLHYSSSEDSTVDEFIHADNSEGAVGGDTSRLTIGQRTNRMSDELDVPDREDVGAFTGCPGE